MDNVETILDIETLPENKIPHELSLLLPEGAVVVLT